MINKFTILRVMRYLKKCCRYRNHVFLEKKIAGNKNKSNKCNVSFFPVAFQHFFGSTQLIKIRMFVLIYFGGILWHFLNN